MDRLAIIAILLNGMAGNIEKWELDWAISKATQMLENGGWVKNSVNGRWQPESA